MTKYLPLMVALSFGTACGGTTGNGNGPYDADESTSGKASSGAAGKGGAGSSSGAGSGGNSSGGGGAGAGNGGRSNGGASNGGASNGGASNGGASNGGASSGGVSNGGVSSGGGGASSGGSSADPRCPARTPQGACMPESLQCRYDVLSHCLCASNGGAFAFCQQVDPDCVAAAPPPAAGSGGFWTKIAAPSFELCSCVPGGWSCGLLSP